jgi:hypothetical protein
MGGPNGSAKTLPTLEFVKGGARLSPSEDFKIRTLAAVVGLWAKLAYMAELRSEDGRYEHWGHRRVHGEAQSQAALASIHSELYIELLRTPVRKLAEELNPSSLINDGSRTISQLERMKRNAIPENPEGGSRRHFNSLLLTARLLNADRQVSTGSSASQSQLPVK